MSNQCVHKFSDGITCSVATGKMRKFNKLERFLCSEHYILSKKLCDAYHLSDRYEDERVQLINLSFKHMIKIDSCVNAEDLARNEIEYQSEVKKIENLTLVNIKLIHFLEYELRLSFAEQFNLGVEDAGHQTRMIILKNSFKEFYERNEKGDIIQLKELNSYNPQKSMQAAKAAKETAFYTFGRRIEDEYAEIQHVGGENWDV